MMYPRLWPWITALVVLIGLVVAGTVYLGSQPNEIRGCDSSGRCVTAECVIFDDPVRECTDSEREHYFDEPWPTTTTIYELGLDSQSHRVVN